MTDRDRRMVPSVLVGDALLLLCALGGLTASFLSLYGGYPAVAPALNDCAADGELFVLCPVVFALLALAAFSLPRFWGAAAGTLIALWAVTAALYQTEAVQGAGITARDISVLFSRRVDWGQEFSYDPGLMPTKEAAAVQLFLLLALAGMALLLGWAVVRARRWWLVLAFTLPPLLPGLLADFYPDWPGFMALAACWCVMLITALCKWAAPSGRGKLTLIVFPCVAAVLALITLVYPREGYTRPAWALEAQENLMNLTNRAGDFFSQWDGPFKRTVTYVGSAEEVDLANAGPLNYFGRTVLRVKSDYDGRLYLRGSSLAVYEDGVWKALPEGMYDEYAASLGLTDSPLYFPAMLKQNSPAYTVTVNNVGAVGACVYTPYFPIPQDFEETGALAVEDAYFARKQGQWTHTMTFVECWPSTFIDISSGGTHIYAEYANGSDLAQSAAAAYTDYAYDNYLAVPEELQDTLDGMIDQVLHYPAELTSEDVTCYQIEYAHRIAAWMEASFEYDTETSPAPDGVDPVLYFLTEGRRGYCMHFASAATLMLRGMGVPARYVSGFTAVSVPDKQVDVPDRAAHAWVEVWVDGFGWYPVEVTPAAAFAYETAEAADPIELPSEAPSETPVVSSEPEPTDTPAPSGDVPGSTDDTPGGGGDGPGLALSLPGWAKGLLWTAALAALLWSVQLGVKRFRAKRMAGPDANRAALVCYGYLCRLERWGGRMDGRAVELAQKARFSQHTLTEEELYLLRRLVDRERTRLCVTSSLPKRLVFRYLWGLPKPLMSLADDVPL